MVQGLLGGKQVAIQTPLKSEDDPEAVEFLHCAIDTVPRRLDVKQDNP